MHQAGAAAPERLVGDFAFVAYASARRELIAARDPFGVKTLYYAQAADHVIIASHANVLATGGYDEEFIATFLLGNVAPTSNTIYAGVGRIPAAGVLSVTPERELRIMRYWMPRPAQNAPQRLLDAAECFRERFTACVRTRIADDPRTCAELSGGIDSSSVVVTAHHLAGTGDTRPLCSTLTYVDSLGEGDERPFVDAIIARVKLPQLIIQDDWPWRDDREAPPKTDEPSTFSPFFARNRRTIRALRRVGARVLLSGHGADHYLSLSGNPAWLADLLARGRVVQAMRACAAIALAHRISIWRVIRGYALPPLLPPLLRYQHALMANRLPQWLSKQFARSHDMRGRLAFMRLGRQGMASRFHDAIAIELAAVQNGVPRVYDEAVEMRFPFLDRQLVELALGLPWDFIQTPETAKVVLREAMRGRLVDAVRQRTTKGTIDARILWALIRERERIDALIHQPRLADIGAIDAVSLRRTVDEARRGHVVNTAFLLSTLALETWLAVRDGRWLVSRAV